MIGKNWNNQYCYNRLILENYVKITKMKIMRWKQIRGPYVNVAMITEPLNTKLLLTRKPE